MKKRIIIFALVIVAAAAYYFISNYESPAEIQAKKEEINIKLIQSKEDLVVIESYLAAREKGIIAGQELSDLQDKIILASDGLVTATKDDLISFDRQAGALRTIFQLEVDELSADLSKYTYGGTEK